MGFVDQLGVSQMFVCVFAIFELPDGSEVKVSAVD